MSSTTGCRSRLDCSFTTLLFTYNCNQHIMRNIIRCLPLLALMACKHQATDVQPKLVDKTSAANYDALAKDTGYWRWTSTYIPFHYATDSSSVGYSRHLVFKNDSTMLIHRSDSSDLIVPYHLATTYFSCSSNNVKTLMYNTKEAALLAAHIYPQPRSIKLRSYPNGTSELELTSNCFGLDSGYSELYRWVPEP